MPISEKFLSIGDVYGSDPLASLLLRGWHVRPSSLALISLLIGFGYMGGLAAIFGYFSPQPGIIASLIDVYNQLNFFVIFPSVTFYYLWQPSKIAQTYTALIKHINNQGDVVNSLLSDIRKANAHQGWWLAGIFIGFLVIGVGVYDNYLKLGIWWYSANWAMIGVLQGIRGIIFYMLAIICARHLATTIGLSRIYKQFEIPLIILPASQTRGIQAVGHYAFTFVAFVAVIGISVGIAPVLSTGLGKDYIFQLIWYFTFAPAGFLLPLWQVHGEMAQSKIRIIDDLSTKYQKEYDQLLNNVVSNDKVAKENLARLKTLQESYELAQKSWTWPFDTSLLYRVGITILAPFSPLALQFVQNFIAELFTKYIAP